MKKRAVAAILSMAMFFSLPIRGMAAEALPLAEMTDSIPTISEEKAVEQATDFSDDVGNTGDRKNPENPELEEDFENEEPLLTTTEYTSGLFRYTLDADGNATIVGATGENLYEHLDSRDQFVIPATLDGHRVIAIGNAAFSYEVFGEGATVVISDGIQRLGCEAFYNSYAARVRIPKSVIAFEGMEYFEYVFSYMYSLEEIWVDPENPAFCSIDGVLYSKDKSVLYNYPGWKNQGEYTTPAETSMLACTSFALSSMASDDPYCPLQILNLTRDDCSFMTYTFFGRELTVCGTENNYNYWSNRMRDGWDPVGVKKFAIIGQSGETVHTTAVVFDANEYYVKTGGKVTIAARTIPFDSNDKEFFWSSSNTSVATVNARGTVTGISGGKRVSVTAQTKKDGVRGSVAVVVGTEQAGENEEEQNNSEEQVRGFVTRMYRVALGRSPGGAEADGWIDDLKSGRKTGADIAQGFYMSPEIFSTNPSSEEYVELAYLGMMNRASDAGGKADWVDALNSGVTCNAIIRGFVGSQEFHNLCADYGIQPGEVTVTEPRDQNVGITKFVARLYTQALGRSYDVGGLNDWTSQILANPSKANILNIATNGFLNSREFLNKGLSDEDFVRVMYRTFLGREADPDGLNDWLNRMANGASRDEVAAGFANSVEFANIMANYGL